MVSWLILTGGSVAVAVIGLRFRSGKPSPWMPSWMGLYRRTDLPTIYRNVPLITPLLGLGMLVIMVAGAPALLSPRLEVAGVPEGLVSLYWFCLVGAFPLLAGMSLVLAAHPPAWLRPRWLRALDSEDTFDPPAPSRFDHAVFVVGTLLLLLGLTLVTYGLGAALT